MMAVVVLALGIAGMIQVLVYGAEMMDVSRKQTIATQIIRGQIDHVRLSDWAKVTALPPTASVKVDARDAGGDQTANVQAGFVFGLGLPALSGGFDCQRTISSVRTDLFQVTYTVTWTGRNGRPHARSGSTYIGRNGLYVTYQRS